MPRKRVRFPKTCICEGCGKQYVCAADGRRGRFCSHPCYTAWSKTRRPEHLPPPVMKKCLMCDQEFQVKLSDYEERVTCSLACNRRWQIEYGPRGENHPTWNGGAASYYGPNWRAQRRAARKRDGYTCQRCGITEDELGQALDVHHIRRFNECSDYLEANQLSNLICYCRICHLVIEPRHPRRQPIEA